MRQFTDISVTKWEDPRASALTSYSISPNQAKTSKFRRVIGSAPLKQTYEISSDDDDGDSEQDSDNSEDGKNSKSLFFLPRNNMKKGLLLKMNE